jgi:hypothetical protein
MATAIAFSLLAVTHSDGGQTALHVGRNALSCFIGTFLVCLYRKPSHYHFAFTVTLQVIAGVEAAVQTPGLVSRLTRSSVLETFASGLPKDKRLDYS